MLKTLKRKIALVAVAGLGFGLVSTVPANAAGAALAMDDLALTAAGSTLVVTNVTAGGSNGVDTAKARAGTQTIVLTEIDGVQGATDYNIIVSTAAAAANIAVDGSNVATLNTPTYGGVAASSGLVTTTAASNAASAFFSVAGKAIVVDAVDGDANTTTVTFNTSSLTAGTWNIFADGTPANTFTAAGTVHVGTITVYNVGAPVTVAFDQVGRTQIVAAAADSSFVASVKDSAGRSTFLRGTEAITYSFDTVASGICAPTTPTNTAAANQAYDGATATFTGYTVALDTTSPAACAGGANATANTTFKLNATIISGLAAFGTTSATFRWSTTSSGLVGTLRVLKQSDSTAVTAISLPASGTVANTTYKWELKDSTGAVVEGVTPTASSSAGSTIASAAATSSAGAGNAFTYTAAGTAGTDTLTFTVTAGSAASITTSIAVTVTGYGATAPVITGVTVSAGNGTGFVAGTAPAWTAGLTVTKVNVVVTGLEASKVAAVSCTEVADPTNDTTCAVDAATPVADSTGKITIVMSITGTPENGDRYTVDVDADAGGALASLQAANVTWATATADVTTLPAKDTNTFAAASATIPVVATAADQFSVASPGATVTMTNTVVPVGATAQTAATQTVGADGKSTFNVVLGSKVGTYTYTFTGRTYNNVAMATTNTVSFTVTASGSPAAITITGGVNTSTTTTRIRIDADGDIATNGGACTATANTVTTKLIASTCASTIVTVKVTDDSGAGAAGVVVTAAPSDGVLVNSAAAANVLYSAFNSATTDLKIATDGTGVATFYVTGTKVGTGSITFSAGSATVKGEFLAIANSQLDDPAAAMTGRTVTLDKATAAINGNVVQVIATVKDVWGNPVAGVNLAGAITGTAGRFTGGGRTQAAVATDANGQVVFEVTSNGVEAGTGTLTVTATAQAIGVGGGDPADARTDLIADDLTANGAIFTAAATRSATSALTVTAATAASSPEITAVKADVKAVSDTVATLSKAVTTIQSSVTELTSSFATQIKSLTDAIAKISKAIAALSKKVSAKK